MRASSVDPLRLVATGTLRDPVSANLGDFEGSCRCLRCVGLLGNDEDVVAFVDPRKLFMDALGGGVELIGSNWTSPEHVSARAPDRRKVMVRVLLDPEESVSVAKDMVSVGGKN